MTAAAAHKVADRETRKPEFPATVHAYTDALQLLRDTPGLTADQISDQTGRLKWNVKRDLHKLVDAGVIEGKGGDHGDKAWSLTPKGTRWVEGIDVASGRAPAATGTSRAPEVLLAQLAPDPDQPRKAFDEDQLRELADSIADKGLLQPILVRVPVLVGPHIIIAGERRYRAIKRLAEQGRWPAAKGVAVRFATPEDEAEVMELALVENTQRTDLNHMELALGYQRLADLGRTPKQIASVVGRTNDHVTQHLRLTRLDADDQAAVAAGTLPLHQALEKLRAPKVEGETDGQPSAEGDPLVVNGIRYPNTTRAQEARYAAGLEERKANHSARSATAEANADEPPLPFDDEPAPSQSITSVELIANTDGSRGAVRVPGETDDRRIYGQPSPASPTLSPRARLALIELAHKSDDERRPWEGHGWGASVGSYWLDTTHSELTAAGLATFAQVRGGLPPIAAYTGAGAKWLDQQEGLALPVTTETLQQFREDHGLGGDWPYATPWLAQVAQPAAGAAPVAEDSTQPGTATETPDQAEAALDETILALVAADGEILTANPAKVFADLGIRAATTTSAADDGVIALWGPAMRAVTHLTVDVNGELPDTRAQAIAALIAHQLSRVLA